MQTIENLIRRGELGPAKRELRALVAAGVPRSRVAETARLCRKAGLLDCSVRLLRPIVLRERRGAAPSPLETAEYAVALVNLGATREGAAKLAEVEGREHPRVWLLRSFMLIREWNWSDAVPLLESYLAHSRLSELERLTGRVYLATCLMHGERDLRRSREMVEEASARLSSSHARRTALLLLAQNHVMAGHIQHARQLLDQIEDDVASRGNELQTLMTRQWRALSGLQAAARPRARRGDFSELHQAQQGFEAIGAWEWARSCEIFAAEITGDRSRLTKHFFGAPYPALRTRLRKELGGEEALPDRYIWRLGDQKVRTHCEMVVDPLADLKPGQLPQRILLKLCSDFFRPFPIAEIHEAVFPDEIYHPVTSPDRVHKGLRRLRAWLTERGTGLRVIENRGGYRLALAPGHETMLQIRREPGQPSDPRARDTARTLSSRVRSASFSTTEAALALSLPPRTAARRLAETRAARLIEAVGSGRAVRYRIISVSNSAE